MTTTLPLQVRLDAREIRQQQRRLLLGATTASAVLVARSVEDLLVGGLHVVVADVRRIVAGSREVLSHAR